MNPIDAIIAQSGRMILDGALATELERRGCALDDPLWSARMLMESPEIIAAVHRDYLAAGADCITTASYQATVAGFTRRGLSETQAVDLIRSSVVIAKAVCEEFWRTQPQPANRPHPLVAASVGPYGAFLADGSEYSGNYSRSTAALEAFHRQRLEILIAASPDLLACETIPCLDEALVLAHLLKRFPAMSAWISFSARNGQEISNGEHIADCARALARFPQIAAIGINCTAPEHITELIGEIRANTTKLIIVYPNAGERYDVATHAWIGPSIHDRYADHALAWRAAGARLIGGCCRTTPTDIAAVAAAIPPTASSRHVSR